MTTADLLRYATWAYVIGWPIWFGWSFYREEKRKDAEFAKLIVRYRQQARQALLNAEREVHLSEVMD